jgi:hypothetical protein
MMKELSMELKQRMAEAGKDTEWVEKVRCAATWEAYEKLLAEKGIEATAELKEAFATDRIIKAGKLEDDELEKVSGGWTNVFNCPKEYNSFLCDLTFCPHRNTRDNTPDEDHYDKYCDLGYWSFNLNYPQG